MIVLSRKRGESIVLTLPDGRRIYVTLCRVGDVVAHIGIDAPLDVSVHRAEVQAEIDEELATMQVHNGSTSWP